MFSGLAHSLFSFECDSHSAHAQCGFLGMLCFVPDVWEDRTIAADAVFCLLHGVFLYVRLITAVMGEQMSEYIEGPCTKQSFAKYCWAATERLCLTNTGIFCLAQLSPVCPYRHPLGRFGMLNQW